MEVNSKRAVEVFYSYASRDELLCKELEKQLSNLKRQGLIRSWYDRDINAGTDWAHEIDTHLNKSDLILLLISPDFMYSDYCYSFEMRRALERHEAGEAHVIPIILRPVDWKDTPFSKLQALPQHAKPVTRWRYRDDAFLNIAQGIREAVQKINSTNPSLNAHAANSALTQEKNAENEAIISRNKVNKIITSPDFFERHAEANLEPHSQPFDHLICRHASLADLDLTKINEFFKTDKVQLQQDFHAGAFDQDQLLQFGLFKEAHPSYGALLCFGQNPQKLLSGAFTRCIYWPGNDRHLGWLEDQTYRGDLLNQFKSSRDFLKKHLRLSRVIGREGRAEQWEIPFVALEEALANALVHREYANRTDFIHVEVFNDRIEISSPGDLPPPMTLELLETEHKCHPRNPQIARIFYLSGYVEEVGSGIQRMQYVMKEAGLLPAKLELLEDKTFKVILYRPKQVSINSDRTMQGMNRQFLDAEERTELPLVWPGEINSRAALYDPWRIVDENMEQFNRRK